MCGPKCNYEKVCESECNYMKMCGTKCNYVKLYEPKCKHKGIVIILWNLKSSVIYKKVHVLKGFFSFSFWINVLKGFKWFWISQKECVGLPFSVNWNRPAEFWESAWPDSTGGTKIIWEFIVCIGPMTKIALAVCDLWIVCCVFFFLKYLLVLWKVDRIND